MENENRFNNTLHLKQSKNYNYDDNSEEVMSESITENEMKYFDKTVNNLY